MFYAQPTSTVISGQITVLAVSGFNTQCMHIGSLVDVGETLTMALPEEDQPTYCSCLSSMWPFTLNSSLNTQKHTVTLNTTTACTTLSPLFSPSFFHLFLQTNSYTAH